MAQRNRTDTAARNQYRSFICVRVWPGSPRTCGSNGLIRMRRVCGSRMPGGIGDHPESTLAASSGARRVLTGKPGPVSLRAGVWGQPAGSKLRQLLADVEDIVAHLVQGMQGDPSQRPFHRSPVLVDPGPFSVFGTEARESTLSNRRAVSGEPSFLGGCSREKSNVVVLPSKRKRYVASPLPTLLDGHGSLSRGWNSVRSVTRLLGRHAAVVPLLAGKPGGRVSLK